MDNTNSYARAKAKFEQKVLDLAADFIEQGRYTPEDALVHARPLVLATMKKNWEGTVKLLGYNNVVVGPWPPFFPAL